MTSVGGPTTPPRWREAAIGLGSNLGDRAENLRRARLALADHPAIRLLAESPVYQSDPVGVTDQPVFYNQVAAVATILSPEELLALLLEIETGLGRVRSERWGPRLIDLDLLVYFGETRDTPGLRLPHPRMQERPFVIIPLLDLIQESLSDREQWIALADWLPRPGVEAGGLQRMRQKT